MAMDFPLRIFPQFAWISPLATTNHWFVFKSKSTNCSLPHTQVSKILAFQCLRTKVNDLSWNFIVGTTYKQSKFNLTFGIQCFWNKFKKIGLHNVIILRVCVSILVTNRYRSGHDHVWVPIIVTDHSVLEIWSRPVTTMDVDNQD